MIIHKSDKYTITTDGITAVKTGPEGAREMPFFPERDVEAVAGEIDELTAWQLLYDLAVQAPVLQTPVMPSHIFIDGNGFRLSEWSASEDSRFTAPEGYCKIWAIGATVFFLFMGCHVFHGLGGKGQTSTTPIPKLRKDLDDLNRIVEKCLRYRKEERASFEELMTVARINRERLSNRAIRGPKRKVRKSGPSSTTLDELWPEVME